ncbi:MAG: TolC family protein [Candidatus Cyclobacteriaceae bacterium M3_2C_046]
MLKSKDIFTIFIVASSMLLSIMSVNAQDTGIEQVLQKIKQNNKTLKAYQEYVKGQTLNLSAGNNLPDPEASGYYLPFGDSGGGDYTEFQVSQSFEFPTVYAQRRDLIDLQTTGLELGYINQKQEILLEAQKLLQELVYLNKVREIEQARMDQAYEVFQQTNELYEQEQVGILELNKSRIAWMEEQFTVEQIDDFIRTVQRKLEYLNGDQEINLSGLTYDRDFTIEPVDSLWNEKLDMEPSLLSLRNNDKTSMAKVKLSQSQSLPDLTFGFNRQGIPGTVNSGFLGGVEIPLWNNRNKIKSAKALYKFERLNTENRLNEYFTQLQGLYNQYQLTLQKYTEYQNTLSKLNSEELLLEAYRLGEISFIDFYQELRFYRQAYDAMLEMELQLHRQKAELLKHRLTDL